MKFKFIITDLFPYDGEYEIDLANLSNRDFHDIKRIAGYTPPELEDALARGDTDLIVALSVIALRRSKKFERIDEDLLWDAGAGNFDAEPIEQPKADDADPTTTPLEHGTPSTPSGERSPSGGDKEAARILRPTGTDSSDSSTYVQMISET